MVAHIHTIAFQGIETVDVDVQAHLTNQNIAKFNIVGLPDKAIGESKERIYAALSSMGIAPMLHRITVNLAPADLIKEGSHYDLAIAVSLLVGLGILPAEEIASYVILGELSLDGNIVATPGTLPAAIHAVSRQKGLICPSPNGQESRWASDTLEILAPDTLLALINHFKGTQILTPPSQAPLPPPQHYADLKDIKGQPTARRALEIAAAGGHHLLMSGPPGAGKSMLASRLPSILPGLTSREMLDVSMIASVAGKIKGGTLYTQRPYRDPHHSCSMAAMVGGGRMAKPGEITLAHHGVLFLDELPEFPRNVLESLRQPLETGTITVSRAEMHVTYPARFQLVAAMNPCRCGFADDPNRACSRIPRCVQEYRAKLSGPFLDRIDMFIDVPPVPIHELQHAPEGEASLPVRQRIQKVRNIQKERYKHTSISCNAHAYGSLLTETATPEEDGKTLLNKVLEKGLLSMRGYHRLLRVARTIADMEESKTLHKHHISEALSYRKIE